MTLALYGMDTGFYNSLGSYDFDVRCEMLAELGYAATYLTAWSPLAWSDVPRLATVRDRHGLDVAGVYATVDADAPLTHEGNARVLSMIESLEGCSTVELAVKNERPGLERSDPAGDEAALAFLDAALRAAEPGGTEILLYPHVSSWLERIGDAVRLCRAADHPQLGLVFPSYHWYAVDGTDLPGTLAGAGPYLRQVNTCGSRREPWLGLPATIEPVDTGELDNFALIGSLRSMGYDRMVGIQGFGMGGDAYTHLRRSIGAVRDIESRLDAHPEWARLRPRSA